MRERRLEFSVQPREEGSRLSSFLRGRGVSLTQVRSLKYVDEGLRVNGWQARTNQKLAAGDVVSLQLAAEDGFSVHPQALPLEVIYHSPDALVVNKPAGMATHPGPSHHLGTLANAVCGLLGNMQSSGIFRPIGRLDVYTSGLSLCAGNALSAATLAKSMKKTYLALVGGAVVREEGLIDAPLAPMTGSTVRQQVTAQGRPSRTQYRVLAAGEECTLVAARPLTGRTHQIRAHFAHLGHPLLGDNLYGGDTRVMKRQALHCTFVRFAELSGNTLGLCCRMPNDMYITGKVMGLDMDGADIACRLEWDDCDALLPGPGCQNRAKIV